MWRPKLWRTLLELKSNASDRWRKSLVSFVSLLPSLLPWPLALPPTCK